MEILSVAETGYDSDIIVGRTRTVHDLKCNSQSVKITVNKNGDIHICVGEDPVRLYHSKISDITIRGMDIDDLILFLQEAKQFITDHKICDILSK